MIAGRGILAERPIIAIEQTQSDREGFIQDKLPMYMYNQVYDSTCTASETVVAPAFTRFVAVRTLVLENEKSVWPGFLMETHPMLGIFWKVSTASRRAFARFSDASS